jgi:hypothetical protein
VLADRRRPDERILTLAVAGPDLIGGPRLLAATDQRLLLLWPSSQCEELQYGSLVSVSDDSSAGAIALVTEHQVHALTISPPARAAEIIAAVAARIGQDQIHPAAGAAIARRMQAALLSALVAVCVFVAVSVLDAELFGGGNTPQQSDRPLAHLATGQCLDLDALSAACTSVGATFVVLKPRGKQRCANATSAAADLARTEARKRELARWCIGWTTSTRR